MGWERNAHLEANFTGKMISCVILAQSILRRKSITGIHTHLMLRIQHRIEQFTQPSMKPRADTPVLKQKNLLDIDITKIVAFYREATQPPGLESSE